ncbi:MAG: hypothetical protein ACXV5J_12580, partial [Candidatus Angelobacter sp.]
NHSNLVTRIECPGLYNPRAFFCLKPFKRGMGCAARGGAGSMRLPGVSISIEVKRSRSTQKKA